MVAFMFAVYCLMAVWPLLMFEEEESNLASVQPKHKVIVQSEIVKNPNQPYFGCNEFCVGECRSGLLLKHIQGSGCILLCLTVFDISDIWWNIHLETKKKITLS